MSIQMNNESLVAPVEPVKSTSALTSYAESAPSIEVVETTRDAKLDVISNPYEAQDMKKVLERSYKVAEEDWIFSDASGTNLLTVNFPDALLLIENIQDKLAQFEYLKSDVEVEVKINATPFHIGSLNVSFFSHANETTEPIIDAAARLNKNSTIVSISSENSVKIRIPRTGPLLWDRVHQQAGDACYGSIGTLFVDVLDKMLTLSGTAASNLKVAVFANFVNPKVAGYGVTTVSPLNVKRKARRLTAIKETSPVLKKSLEEGQAKSKTGMISGIAEAVGSAAPLLAATPFAEFAPIAALGKTFAPFLASLGLSKPTDQSSTVKTADRSYDDQCYMHGLTMGTKLSAHPDAMLKDTDVSDLRRHKILDLIKIPGHVLASKIDSTTAAGVTFLHFPINPGLCKWDGTNYYPSYLALFSQMFMKWRGGIKVSLKFVTSQFTTARVRILHLPNASLPPDIEAFAGDIPNTVVDIRGNTEFEFTLPYLSTTVYNPTSGYNGPQQDAIATSCVVYPTTWLSVSLVNPVNIPDPGGNSTIYYHVHVAAAEDFKFGEFTGYVQKLTAYAPPAFRLKKEVKIKEQAIVAKKSLERKFLRPFKPLVPAVGSEEVGMVLPEHVTSVEEILKRWRQDLVLSSNPTGVLLQTCVNAGSFVSTTTTGKLCKLFTFYRGALRYKAQFEASANINTANLVTTPDSTLVDTDIKVMASKTPPLEFEVPWMANSYCMPLYPSCPQDSSEGLLNNGHWVQLIGTPARVFFSVGEDFMFGGPLPPIKYSPIPPLEQESKQKTDYSESVSSLSDSFHTIL